MRKEMSKSFTGDSSGRGVGGTLPTRSAVCSAHPFRRIFRKRDPGPPGYDFRPSRPVPRPT
ncbi:hypothetical protein GCM10027160_49760 [Streptomyces calidiresistens]